MQYQLHNLPKWVLFLPFGSDFLFGLLFDPYRLFPPHFNFFLTKNLLYLV